MKEENPAFYKLVQLYRIWGFDENNCPIARSTELFMEDEVHQAKTKLEQADSEGFDVSSTQNDLGVGSNSNTDSSRYNPPLNSQEVLSLFL